MSLKLCLVGAGHMGRIHARKLARMKDVTLTCIVDVNEHQAGNVARECGVPEYRDYRHTLRNGVRAAVIASPTESHYPIARAFLEEGVHVFIEKPIAAEPAQARELIDLARKNNLTLQVGHLERFSPPFRKASAMIKTPLFIEAYRTSGFTGRSTDIDVIHDLMIHDIDLVLSLVNSDIAAISARGISVFTEKIDVANARVEFADGCVAIITASRASGTRERSFKVFDQDRYYSLNLATAHMFTSKKDKKGKMEASIYKATSPDPVNSELREFVRAIRDKREVLVNGEDGLRALLLANTIKEHIEENRAKIVT
ncbi:MAG: Inositol 2-dehydrogenase [Syntrophorhabdaceae bacterium PtaU1.Bin034]|jgi:predicted dehydrogenase|nr:MAG: Inositol 2-dehydrogenase [Syntrophorhabdaceae bacterium PtaU1.Bin034]